jgi:pimeloyl-ACP methyl ester carboxylesterase
MGGQRVFDQGTGPPVVVVPGVHGRWEWARPALQHLARRCRAMSYSLCGDIGSGWRFDPTLGFESYVRQLDSILDQGSIQRTALCGVSFGGFVALRYAAQRPDRVSALVLASVPGPRWRPSPQQSRWLARPWWSAPTFVLTSPLRLWPEVSAAMPDASQRMRFFVRQGVRCMTAPIVPPLMASRIRCAESIDFQNDSGKVRAATWVVTGEESLDRVVPVGSTRMYTSLIRGAEYIVFQQTGHIGVLTQPARFAEIVSGFVHAHHQ